MEVEGIIPGKCLPDTEIFNGSDLSIKMTNHSIRKKNYKTMQIELDKMKSLILEKRIEYNGLG